MKEISNLRNNNGCNCGDKYCQDLVNDSDEPSYEEFCTAKVIVCTLMTCGRLISGGIKSNHFDYIFIDEAGSQTEPDVFVPIVGLGMSRHGIHSQIVFAGDHKQLGPITKADTNRIISKINLGLGISTMERLIETLDYYQDSDPKYIMQLIQNYRSHQAIIEFSNEQFYDGKLKYCCRSDLRDFAIGWKLLTNPDFPVIFHHTSIGNEVKIGSSVQNQKEAEIVVEYVTEILRRGINGKRVKPTEIGVVTGYNGQRSLLLYLLRRYQKVEIGTIDSFQVFKYLKIQ